MNHKTTADITPTIRQYIQLAANRNYVDFQTLETLYRLLLREWRNPYYVLEYLLIKAGDHELARKIADPKASILDVGCGLPISEIIFYAWRVGHVTAVDVDEKAVRIGRAWLEGLGIDYDIDIMDATRLGYDDESFDHVVSFTAIEHMRTYEAYRTWIGELSRVVRPGGKVILTTSNRMNLPMWIMAGFINIKHRNRHYEHFFWPNEVRAMLEDAGLLVEEYHTSLYWYSHWVLWLLPNTIARRVGERRKLLLDFDMWVESVGRRWLPKHGAQMGFVAVKAD